MIVYLVLILSSSQNSLAQTKKTSKVELIHADSLNYDPEIYGKGIRVVFDNVEFKHTNTNLYCDSAFFNRDSNVIVAYGNIHIIQDDSIHLYGDELTYLGNDNLAKIRKNVKMEKGNVTLLTDYLDYDREKHVGYYFNGGTVLNGENTLKSDWGFYYPNQDEAFFKDTVTLHNDQFTLFSDTLKYDTKNEIARITGPTFIVTNTNTIYSEKGYYDTKKDYSQLLKNSYIQGEKQLLKGDTINYDKITGIGEVFNNMELIDTVNNIIVKGNYGYYNEITGASLSTKKAQMLQYQQGDTLYLHADTLRSDPVPETESRLIRAYHHVRFFRPNVQGVCDSMVYNMIDSTNTMYYDPVIWSEGSQMTAQEIIMYNKNDLLDRVELKQSAFIVSLEDSALYDQIKGRDMMGYIRNNELFKIDVEGNAQTVYYPKDGDAIIGVNRAESSNMTIFFKNKKAQTIILRNSPAGNMNPPYILPTEDVRLKGFVWLEIHRPKNKEDIFNNLVMPKMEARKSYDDYVDEGIGNIQPDD